jgi:hypothetical protein
MSKASIPYLMGRNLGSFCGVEVGEGIIVNHREVPLLLARDGAGSIPNWMVRPGGSGDFSREPSFCGVELLYRSV